jgi:hypothetical protein
MKTIKKGHMTTIKSDEGKHLTQSQEVRIEARILTTEVSLNEDCDSVDNWVEIDNETYLAYKTEQEEYNNRLMEELEVGYGR